MRSTHHISRVLDVVAALLCLWPLLPSNACVGAEGPEAGDEVGA